MFAQRGGSNESDATVDGEADNDGQVRHSAADGDRDGLHHVLVVLQRRRVAGQQTLSHVGAYNEHNTRLRVLFCNLYTINHYYYYYYYYFGC